MPCHDHWVESIGDDVILDFNRAAGDTIEVAGHTIGMRDITYGDSNGDGVDDYSLITLYSNQGAGAHNGDDLGNDQGARRSRHRQLTCISTPA